MNKILIIIAVALCSCSSAYRDTKAYTRVITRPKLAEETFRELEKSRPPIINFGQQYSPGWESVNYDTTILKNISGDGVVADSTFFAAHKNISFIEPSTLESQPDRTFEPQSFHFGIDSLIEYIPITKIITKKITRVDTLKTSVEDVRRLNIAVAKYEDTTNYYHGAVSVLTNNVNSEHSRGNKFMWWLIASAVLNLLLAALCFYLFIKNQYYSQLKKQI